MANVSQQMQDCIDACRDVIVAANQCMTTHIGEQEMKRCLNLCLECVQLCGTCMHLVSLKADNSGRLCAICADVCAECADESAKFDSEECRRVVETCRRCAEACRAMA